MLLWTNAAKIDLLDLQLYMVERNEAAGLRLALKIARSAEILETQPRLGRAGVVSNTREWLVPGLNFKLVYQVRDRDVEILRVIHQAMDWT